MRRSMYRRNRGTTLIEALIAMAVMAFGMLAIVGVQQTLRFNADLSKQRNEATRLAEREIENIRATAGSGDDKFDDITEVAASATTQVGDNTEFRLERTITKAADKRSLTAYIEVKWRDRTGEERKVVMHDMLTRVDPMLSGLVRAERPLTPIGRSKSRHPTIPGRAHDLGDGTSIFKPVESNSTVAWVFNNSTGEITHICTVDGASTSTSLTSISGCGTALPVSAQLLAGEIRFNLRGATKDLESDGESAVKPVASGKVAWVINQAVKSVVRVCTDLDANTTTASLTSSMLKDTLPNCMTISSIPIAPFNSADLPSYTLDASDSENPQWLSIPASVAEDGSAPIVGGTMSCYSNAATASTAPTISTTVQKSIEYFCIVIPTSKDGWTGGTRVVPVPFSDDATAIWSVGTTPGKYRVCRYTKSGSDYTTNIDHPKTYGKETSSCGLTCPKVTGNLINQNFLIIHGEKSCPTDVPAEPANGDLINSNTLEHQIS